LGISRGISEGKGEGKGSNSPGEGRGVGVGKGGVNTGGLVGDIGTTPEDWA